MSDSSNRLSAAPIQYGEAEPRRRLHENIWKLNTLKHNPVAGEYMEISKHSCRVWVVFLVVRTYKWQVKREGPEFGMRNERAHTLGSGGGHLLRSGGGHLLRSGGGYLLRSGGGHLIRSGGEHLLRSGGGHLLRSGGGHFFRYRRIWRFNARAQCRNARSTNLSTSAFSHSFWYVEMRRKLGKR